MPRKNESDKRKENEKENIVNNKNEDEKTTNKKENIKEEIANKNNNAKEEIVNKNNNEKEEIANKNNNEKEEIVNKNNNEKEEITNKSNKIKEKVADEKDSEEGKIAKKDQFDIEKLKSIEKEIKKTRKKVSKDVNLKRTNILTNLFIAIFLNVYFAMLLKATINIPAIELLTDFRVFIIFEVICTIVLLEISIKRDSLIFFWFGIEMMFIGVATLAYMNLYGFNYPRMGLFTSLCIGTFTVYYLIKVLIIAIRKVK